jgi:phosphopantothenoylcysteine decarboxylase/phosphopantothenate--cysteine ligase
VTKGKSDRKKTKGGYNFLITAGGTREYIDPVRFIGNASSGRTGYALVRAALKAGHKVILTSTIKELQQPKGAKVVYVESCAEMFGAVKRHFKWCDCLIMAAAVADYAPVKKAKSKIKRKNKAISIRLKPTPDILKWAGEHKRKGQKLIGFALEDKNVKANAETKLITKKVDLIIANSTKSIGSKNTSAWTKAAGTKWLKIGPTKKNIFAKKVIKLIEQRLFVV